MSGVNTTIATVPYLYDSKIHITKSLVIQPTFVKIATENVCSKVLKLIPFICKNCQKRGRNLTNEVTWH
jgi:hypothetical protein